MQTAIKAIWITAIIIVSILMTWFLLGSTAFFKRPTGTSWGYYFMLVGIPVMILVIISIVCFATGWMPRNTSTQIIMIVSIVFVTCFTLFTAPLPIEKEGWLTERVWTHGLVQKTEDGKYEYVLEIINAYQKDSHARLYIKDMAIGEETRIPLNMKNERVTIRGGGATEASVWSHLVASEVSQSIYILTTTEYLNKEIEVFEIDMETKTSRRLE